MTLPFQILIDGKSPFVSKKIEIPFPRHPRWSYVVWPGETPVIAFMFDAWIMHALVINRASWNGQTRLLQTNLEQATLDFHSGHAWTNIDLADALLDETPWDQRALDAVAKDQMDPDVTRHKGSANMSFHNQWGIMALNYGLSPALARAFDAYALKQCRRPRWWVSPSGIPTGSFDSWKDYSPGWMDQWYENVEGLNGWDLEHFDLSELHRMHHLSKDPFYLYIAACTWYDAYRRGWFVREDPNNDYAGNARTSGWWLTATAELLDMKPWPELEAHLDSSMKWHLAKIKSIIENDWPMATLYGNAPPEFMGKPRQKFWQLAVLAWGLQWAKQVGYDEAEPMAEFVLDFIDEHGHEGEIVYNDFTKDMSLKTGSPPTLGTASWILAPMLRSSKPRMLGEFLLDYVKHSGHWPQSSTYHDRVLNYAAPALGHKTFAE